MKFEILEKFISGYEIWGYLKFKNGSISDESKLNSVQVFSNGHFVFDSANEAVDYIVTKIIRNKEEK